MKPKGFPVYVAAPYQRAPLVRELHEAMRKVGCLPTSHWASLAKGPDKLTDPGEVACAIELNRIGVECSALVVAMLFDGEGGEMFVEAGHALWEGIPVLWCGQRQILSCHHPLSRLLPMAAYSCPPVDWSKHKLIKMCQRLAHLSVRSADEVLDAIDDDFGTEKVSRDLRCSANAEALR